MSDNSDEFEPKIVGFLCNWCSYAGADLAGTSRIQYAPNVRIIRVMCTGRLDPSFILRALKDGADGVLISGCHFGDCHYVQGNIFAYNRYLLLKELIAQLGLEPERLKMDFVSASEGERFANMVNNMVSELKKLGPNPLR